MNDSASTHSAASPGPRAIPPAVRQRLQSLFEHGKRSLEKGDHEYAHDLFSQCVSEDPANLIYLQHMRTNLNKRHGEKPKSSLFGGLRKLGGGAGGLGKLAAKGKWTEAFKAGCDTLGKNPFDIATLIAIAELCDQLQARECQVLYLRWALDIDVDNEAANRAAAAAFESLGMFDQAIVCLQRVKKIKPQDHDVAKTISHLSVEKTIKKGGYNQELLRKGSSDSAMPQEGAVQTTDDETTAAESPPAQTAEQQQESEESRLLDAIRLHPTEVGNYFELADLYTHANRLRDAERVLTKALASTGSGNLDVRERLEDAQLRRMRQQVDVAIRKSDTEKTPEAQELARKMMAQANQVELEVYTARSARQPENMVYHFELAMRLKKAGKHREAVTHFQQARSDAKRLADTQLNLGECFQHIEQYRLAMASYEAAIEAARGQQNDELLRLGLYRAGVLATGLKDYDLAEKHLTRLADLDFGYRDVADRLDKLSQIRNT